MKKAAMILAVGMAFALPAQAKDTDTAMMPKHEIEEVVATGSMTAVGTVLLVSLLLFTVALAD